MFRLLVAIAVCLMMPLPYGLLVTLLVASYEYGMYLEYKAQRAVSGKLDIANGRVHILERALQRKRTALRKMAQAIERRNGLLPTGWRHAQKTNDLKPTGRRVGSRGRSLVSVGHEQDRGNS